MKRKKKKIIEKTSTYVFIDATNIIYGTKRLGWRMDFEKLAKYLWERFNAKRILYYAGVDDENKKQLKFYEKLQDFGYSLRLIPVKRFSDGKVKADVDSRMTFEMMLYINKHDSVIVFTGDGDYYWVIEYLQKNKQSIKLFGSGKSVARELKRLLKGNVTDIQLLKQILELKMKP